MSDYDENKNLIRQSTYDDKTGKLTSEYLKEYKKDLEGEYYTAKSVTYDYELDLIHITEYDDHKSIVVNIEKDMDGTVTYDERHEIIYDDDGNIISDKTYVDGVLTHECSGFVGVKLGTDWELTSPEKCIDYYEDGTYMVSLYDKGTDLDSETIYDADGNVIEAKTYDFVYDTDMNLIEYREYINGKISYEEFSTYDEDGCFFSSVEIKYEKDGSKTVCEYDDNFDLVSEKKYDKNGNIVK